MSSGGRYVTYLSRVVARVGGGGGESFELSGDAVNLLCVDATHTHTRVCVVRTQSKQVSRQGMCRASNVQARAGQVSRQGR